MTSRFTTCCGSLLIALFLTACVGSGHYTATSMTNVELSQSNYRIIATDVSGESEAAYLLGISVEAHVATVLPFPLWGERSLYKAALEDLWRNFAALHGKAEGRSLALTNVRFDTHSINVLFFFTRPKLSVRADVVEFTR